MAAEIPDPCGVGRCDHKPIDILAVAVVATVCGATHDTDFGGEEFGRAREMRKP